MTRPRLTDDQFRTLVELLHDTAGLVFDHARRDSLSYSVAERMACTSVAELPAYFDLLAGPDSPELQALIDEVTIPETHFFRNPPQIRALRKYVLPELMRQAAETKRLRVWSAGCSTGEEPYSVAMLLSELLPVSAGWDVKVVGTDISTRALAVAEKATYAERSFVMTDPVDRERFFVPTENGRFAVRPEVRELVEFRHHNLVNDAPPVPVGGADLVLCRNVTIYFDRSTTKRLMLRFHKTLRSGGYLFLGHSETLWQLTDEFALVTLGEAFVYRRPPTGADRRYVLPDRRTENEPRPTRADRRRGPADRRKPTPAPRATDVPGADRRATAVPAQPAAAPGAVADPIPAVREAVAAGRYDDAAALAGAAAEAAPLRAEAHYLHGLALANLGRDPEAVVVLRRAVYLEPDDGFAHFLLAGALERTGEPVAAARSYRAAAGTLGRRPIDAVAPELGGRSVGELAALCALLAERADLAVQGGAS